MKAGSPEDRWRAKERKERKSGASHFPASSAGRTVIPRRLPTASESLAQERILLLGRCKSLCARVQFAVYCS